MLLRFPVSTMLPKYSIINGTVAVLCVSDAPRAARTPGYQSSLPSPTFHRRVKLRAKLMHASPSGDVAVFLGRKRERENENERAGGPAPVESELSEKEWAPVEAALIADEKDLGPRKTGIANPDTNGSWVRRATFRSAFRLNCPPTFTVHNIECNYELVVKVPFPGIGNSLRLVVPVKVTSGIDKPIAKEESDSDSMPPSLDLPPAYWDANSPDWDLDEKEG